MAAERTTHRLFYLGPKLGKRLLNGALERVEIGRIVLDAHRDIKAMLEEKLLQVMLLERSRKRKQRTNKVLTGTMPLYATSLGERKIATAYLAIFFCAEISARTRETTTDLEHLRDMVRRLRRNDGVDLVLEDFDVDKELCIAKGLGVLKKLVKI